MGCHVGHGVRTKRKVVDEHQGHVQEGENVGVAEASADDVVGSCKEAESVGQLLDWGGVLGGGRVGGWGFRGGGILHRLVLRFDSILGVSTREGLESCGDRIAVVSIASYTADIRNGNMVTVCISLTFELAGRY